jgi:hypothetical protein
MKTSAYMRLCGKCTFKQREIVPGQVGASHPPTQPRGECVGNMFRKLIIFCCCVR